MTTTQQILDGVYQRVVDTINQRREKAGKEKLTNSETAEIRQYLESRGVRCTKCFEATTVYDKEYVEDNIQNNCSSPDIVDLINRYVGLLLS